MTWPLQRDCPTFYGRPDANGDGAADRAWEDANLTRVPIPWDAVLCWDTTARVKTALVHKKCAPDLAAIFAEIKALYPSQELIVKARMHLYGGGYTFRAIRGGSNLSMHAYGAAVDFDTVNNPLGRAWKANAGMMQPAVVEIFERHGWVWGGRWRRQDCQHFQAARV